MLRLNVPPYSEEMNVSPWHPQMGVRSGSCHTWRSSDRCLLGGCTFSLLPQETSDLLPVLRVSGVGSPPMPGPCWGFAPRDAGAPKVSHTGAADSCRQEHPWSCGVSWPGALWCIGGCTGLPWPTVLWHLRCPQPKRPLPLGPVCSQSNRRPWPGGPRSAGNSRIVRAKKPGHV